MLEENEITRIYKANVKSLLPIKPQTIDSPIGKINSILINDEFLIQVNERLRIFFPLK